MDLVHTMTKTLDHNRWTALGLAALIACVSAAGCSAWDGKVVSSQTGQVVNADELDAEYVVKSKELRDRLRSAQNEVDAVAVESAQLDAGYESDAQAISDEIAARNAGIGQVAQLAATATGQAWILPLIGVGGIAFGGGVGADNLRKNRIIKQQKAGETPTSGQTA